MNYRNLYCRYYRFIESKTNEKRFDIYWDRYGKNISNKMCKMYIENIIRDKPNMFGGWMSTERKTVGLDFNSPEELDIKLTLNGF